MPQLRAVSPLGAPDYQAVVLAVLPVEAQVQVPSLLLSLSPIQKPPRRVPAA